MSGQRAGASGRRYNRDTPDAVRRVADALLREDRSRWQSGVLMAPGYAAADPSERDFTQTECIIADCDNPSVLIIMRFSQARRRTDATAATWDEAVEREVEFAVGGPELAGAGWTGEFAVPGGEDRDGPVIRRREPLSGAVRVRATPVAGPWRAVRLNVRVENRTAAGPVPGRREDALPSALVAVHLILGVTDGAFVSMTDPPMWAADAVAGCENIGGWPVLADPGRQVMLFSPIIRYDHPELAPESPGELHVESRVPWWDPDAEAALSPGTDSVAIGGRPVRRGSRVRLRPGTRRADAQDMFLAGRLAEVQAVLFDVDDKPYLAVSLAGADLGRFLYFAVDEVEPA
jgi:hypothetical protein